MTDERDDMWELDKLIPKRKKQTGFAKREPEAASELTFGSDKPGPLGYTIPKRPTEKQASDEVEIEYSPENSLILNVKVRKWPTEYTFYDRFLVDAQRYYRSKCEETPFVPYFSYLPQYNQMNIDQLRYYIYWRHEVSNGRYLQTDYSYIFLYFYELINLETVSTPERRLAAMCSLLKGYGKRYARLDKYAGEWICDFCLIHKLPPPVDLLSGVLKDVMPVVGLREFYIACKDDIKDVLLYDFVARNNTYDYKKFASLDKNAAELYDKHLIAAAVYAIEKTEHIKDGSPMLAKTCVTRTAYNGALCVSGSKKKLEVEYLSLNRSYRFRGMITDLVKCAENHLRIALGVRGRLTVKGLSKEAEDAVAEYFEINNIRKPKKEKKTEDSGFDRSRYEAESRGIDLSEAEKIESGSWELTKRLVGEEAAQDLPEAEVTAKTDRGQVPAELMKEETEAIQDDRSAYETLCVSFAPHQLRVLRLIAKGESGEASLFCKASGMLFDAVVSDINDAAADLTGDILIENGKIIEDYEDELAAALEAVKADQE
ncbi:MAG: TerB N-terminal domain-containing protein [Clostridia bacterium]|nr:TerB N-terminal domain-containing protein [Clostridia bacterium]